MRPATTRMSQPRATNLEAPRNAGWIACHSHHTVPSDEEFGSTRTVRRFMSIRIRDSGSRDLNLDHFAVVARAGRGLAVGRRVVLGPARRMGGGAYVRLQKRVISANFN